MIATALTDRLGIQHPIVSAGMGRVSTSRLVSAVSQAGGLGVLGGVTYTPAQLNDEIQRVRAATDKPFGVDLAVSERLLSTDDMVWGSIEARLQEMSPEQLARMGGFENMFRRGSVREQIDVVLEAAPAVIALAYEAPRWLVDECHRRGIAVLALVGTVRRALAAAESGVDFIVAQGAEAGGHTGQVSASVLVPSVVDAVGVPVLAAGGITDGRGVAAALCWGAAGVWVGTRFAATEEAFGHPAYKRALVNARETNTVLTTVFSGRPMRTLDNDYTAAHRQNGADVAPYPEQYYVSNERLDTAIVEGNVDEGMMPAGQCVAMIHDVVTAAEVVEDMMGEAEAALESALGLRSVL